MNQFSFIASLVAVAIAIGAWAFQPTGYGSATQSFMDAKQGFRVNGTEVISSARVGTFTDVTISDTSTSTLAVGCIQANATSSATTVKLVLSTLGATSSFSGTAYWQYGTCP